MDTSSWNFHRLMSIIRRCRSSQRDVHRGPPQLYLDLVISMRCVSRHANGACAAGNVSVDAEVESYHSRIIVIDRAMPPWGTRDSLVKLKRFHMWRRRHGCNEMTRVVALRWPSRWICGPLESFAEVERLQMRHESSLFTAISRNVN